MRSHFAATRRLEGGSREPGCGRHLTSSLERRAYLSTCSCQIAHSALIACHLGWPDDSSGPLLCCKGSCSRAFHTACHPHFPLETQICGRCSGEDSVICCKCDLEWSDPDPQSDFYSGEMAVCEGMCGRWFHQQCHQPIITVAQINSKKKWICTDCTIGQSVAPIANAATAAPAAATTAPTATAAPTTATTTPTAPAATAPTDVIAAPKAGWEAVELVLFRGARGYGFFVSLQDGVVDEVMPGMSGAVAGLESSVVIVGVNDARLRHYELIASQLIGRQCEGTRLKLTAHRRCQANNPNKRQQTAARQQPGMQAFTGVRLGDGARTHIERLAATFATGTASCL